MGVNGPMVQGPASKASWSTTVMAQYLPPWLTRAGLPPRLVRRIKVTEVPLEKTLLAELAALSKRKVPFDLYLAQNLFLQITVNLPYAARKEFSAAVALQIRQTMPGQAAGLVWRQVTPNWRRSKTAEVSVYLIKEATLKGIVGLAGRGLRRILVDGVDVVPLVDNRRRTDRAERFWNIAAFALAILALTAVLGFQFSRYQLVADQVADAKARVAALRDTAAETRAGADLRRAEFAVLTDDMARFERESQPLAIISDLSRVLDDRVWLSSFVLDGTVLRLDGFAEQDIANVVSSVRKLDWVASVELEGAIVIDEADGEQRFQLLVNIRDTEAKL